MLFLAVPMVLLFCVAEVIARSWTAVAAAAQADASSWADDEVSPL